MALEFKTIDDLKALEASSSEGIANQAQQQFKPTGDLWYDIGAGMTQGLQAYQANRKQAYQDFKGRHEGQSFVPGEEDKEWMYKKMLREEGGMSSKDIRNKAMQVFRPEQYETNMERKKNLSQLGSDISKVPGAIGKGLTNVKNFLTDKKRLTPSKEMKQDWQNWTGDVKEGWQDLIGEYKDGGRVKFQHQTGADERNDKGWYDVNQLYSYNDRFYSGDSKSRHNDLAQSKAREMVEGKMFRNSADSLTTSDAMMQFPNAPIWQQDNYKEQYNKLYPSESNNAKSNNILNKLKMFLRRNK